MKTEFLVALALFFAPPQSSTHHPETQTYDRIELTGRYYISGVARHSSIGKQVWVDYVATSSGPGDARIAADSVTRAVDFVPTSTAVLNSRLIAVGGRSSADPSVSRIELWSLTEPTVALVTDPATGSRSHVMSGAEITGASLAFESSAAGMRGVRRMIRLRGKPSSLLVQFDDSADSYELDYASSPASATLKFKSAPGGAAPVIARLSDRALDATHGRRHSTAGFIYLLMPQMRAGQLPDAPDAGLALIDADYDGAIDTWLDASANQLRAWRDSGYVEVDLASKW